MRPNFRTEPTPQLNALLKTEQQSKGIEAHMSNFSRFDRDFAEVERELRHGRINQIIRSAEYIEALARKHHGSLPQYAMDFISTQLDIEKDKKDDKKEKQDEEEKQEED